jgi:hypothetical protein
MHMASANLSLDVFPRVVALVMFGDPGQKENTRVRSFPVYLGSRLRENCADGDPVRFLPYLLLVGYTNVVPEGLWRW